jgi:hypothetical protein
MTYQSIHERMSNTYLIYIKMWRTSYLRSSKWKAKQYHTVGTFLEYCREIVERGKIENL